MNRMPSLTRLFTAISVCTVLLSVVSCIGSSEFSVTMTSPESSVNLSVVLPDTPLASDIVFIADGVKYIPTDLPTVNDPTFVLYASIAPGSQPIMLTMADDSDGIASLRIRENDGTEAVFTAEMTDFKPLLDFLRTN